MFSNKLSSQIVIAQIQGIPTIAEFESDLRSEFETNVLPVVSLFAGVFVIGFLVSRIV